jgi:hypothetical protein
MVQSKTTKKVKIVGTESYINASTGKMEEFQVVKMEDRDFDFHKVWIHAIIDSLDLIGNKKTKLAFWIVEHLNRDNQLIMTYRQIAEKSGTSLETVNATMKTLLDTNFLRRINQGAYCVNPDVLFKGTRSGRLNVLFQYQKLESPNSEEEEMAEEPEN